LELVAALAELCSRAPALDPVMIVAGDGSLREPLTRAVSGAALDARVRLLGWRRDVPAILAAADVLYLPSFVEGLPLTLIEAACMGIPTVASNSKGCREVIVDGETGLLVPPGDADAAARALAEVLGSPERARRLGEAAARRGRELYDVRAMALAVERVYEELLG
jgi:glycosyltransferase involved in cell wall biosynthesis